MLAYNLVSRFLSFAFSSFYGVPCISYFDDFSGVAPTKAIGDLCLSLFKDFSESLGFPVKDSKSEVGRKIQYLGLDIEAVEGVTVAVPSQKRVNYCELISAVVKSGVCSQSDADSLYGKLQWCSSNVFGRGLKVRLSPLLRQKFSKNGTMPEDLKWSLRFFGGRLLKPRVRRFVEPSKKVDFIAFSDAPLSGLGACVVPCGGGVFNFAARVPEGFHNSLPVGVNPIFILELVAAVFAVRVVSKFFRGDGVSNAVIFIDNNASLCSIVRAYTKCKIGLQVVGEFWSAVDGANVLPWVERIPSALNWADEPSRDPKNAHILTFEWAWPGFKLMSR